MSQEAEAELSMPNIDLAEKSPELDDNQTACVNGEIVSALLTPETSLKAEHQVVALLPLIRELNRSLSRLYRFVFG